MNKTKIMMSLRIWGCFFAMTAVVLGAFASHGLKGKISVESFESFQVGVRYMMYHGLALLLFSILHETAPRIQMWTLLLFGIGILLFSGSIFLLSTQSLHQLKVSFLGPITPFGGLCLIVGWAMQIVYYFKT